MFSKILEVHQYLWDHTDRRGRVEILQGRLAETFQCTQATMSLAMKEMSAQGRIKKISAKKGNIGTYVIRDPTTFQHDFVPTVVPKKLKGLERCKVCGEFEDIGKHPPPSV